MKSGRTIRVAFQGEHGAFSEEAARKLLGPGVRTVPRPTFEALFQAIHEGASDRILAPLENTLAGTVQRSYDLLFGTRLSIVGEVVLPIAHHLIGCPGARVRTLQLVQSHPVALAQCEQFFVRNPHLMRLAADDTAGSVREIVQRGDPTRAAIAGEYAAKLHGARILRRHLEDHRRNFTRFVLLATTAQPSPNADKLSLVFELPHRPGALCRALEPFARRGFNLLKIESRPIPGRPWEYRFYLDLQALARDPALLPALKELKRATRRLRVLGHYVSAKRKEHGNV